MIKKLPRHTADKVITVLSGGLGNQMFQYATGKALSLRLQVSLEIDRSWFDLPRAQFPRKYGLGCFPLSASVASEHEVEQLKSNWPPGVHKRLIRFFPRFFSHICESSFKYWDGINNLTPPVLLDGYWQSVKYFAEYADAIRAEFSFPALPDSGAKIADSIRQSAGATSLHVRRGDYVHSASVSETHGVCSQAYYDRAIEILRATQSDAHLFIFSDEPEWVRENFSTGNLPSTVVSLGHEDEPWHDMHLMTLCTHHILANSSFSWWGAWLGSGGVNVAPKCWFSAEPKYNPCLHDWILV